jgi:hypothetical protein
LLPQFITSDVWCMSGLAGLEISLWGSQKQRVLYRYITDDHFTSLQPLLLRQAIIEILWIAALTGTGIVYFLSGLSTSPKLREAVVAFGTTADSPQVLHSASDTDGPTSIGP